MYVKIEHYFSVSSRFLSIPEAITITVEISTNINRHKSIVKGSWKLINISLISEPRINN